MNRRLLVNYLEVTIGLILIICGRSGFLDDYWSGMGTALVLVGFIMLVRQHRYKTNVEYKEKVDLEVNDERNKYLRRLAWSWTGYLFVFIAAFGSIVFKLLGMDTYSVVAGLTVCLQITLYWISYLVLRRKY